jgi:dTDP-4-amino-4,6-dideoxygalactose transaminase
VITTPMTFVATLNTIVLAGGRPVLVDIDPTTYNIDVDKIAAAITPQTRAIMPVHFAGLPVDLDPLYDIAQRHQLRVIEDAAHAIGAAYKGRILGSFGDIQVFSFHPNKNMTTGEGGCITTRDEQIHRRITSLRFHGMDRVAWNRFSKAGSQHYDVIEPAHKFNMMDMQAALGLHQLDALDGFIARRTVLAQQYLAALAEWPEFQLPQVPDYEHRHAWHLFAPTLNTDVAKMDRDTLMQRLKDEHNIGTGLHYRAVHLYTHYSKAFGFQPGDFPAAESVGDRILSLPLFPLMKEADVERVVAALAQVLGRAHG